MAATAVTAAGALANPQEPHQARGGTWHAERPRMTSTKLPRSPMRVGLIAFGLTLLIGLVVGMVAILVINPGGDPEQRGELLGRGLAPLSMIIGATAYFIQRKRTGA